MAVLVVVGHLSTAALGRRHRAAPDRLEPGHLRVVRPASQGRSGREVARVTDLGEPWVVEIVHRYDAEGRPGRRDRRRPGRKPRLAPEQEAELAAVVERGPEPDGVVRRRRLDPQAPIGRRFEVRPRERSVGEAPRRLGSVRLAVRPKHPQADEAARAAFRQASASRSRRRSPSTPAASRSRRGSGTRPASAGRAP